MLFQSTHPLRGATPRHESCASRSEFQSTHPLRGATDVYSVKCPRCGISIHAPLAGCDSFRNHRILPATNFNPRTPCGVRLSFRISFLTIRNFNPRTPCGVRPPIIVGAIPEFLFQSTHPLRGATAARHGSLPLRAISIHAPLAGCDVKS